MVTIQNYFIKTFTLLFLATFLSTSLLSYFLLKSYLIEESKKELADNINIIAYKLDSVENLDTFTKEITSLVRVRLTIIDDEGVVLAESSRSKIDMENHLQREEIQALKKSPIAFATRFSHTLSKDFIYGAKKVKYKSQELYLRVAVELQSVMNNFLHIWIMIVLVFTFFILLALYITYKISSRIEADLEQLRLYLREISNRNYEAVIKIENYYEFLEISLILKNMIKKLYTRDKKKNKI